VTGNVHRTWAAFICGYPLLPNLLPTKTAQHHAGTRVQGRRHLVTAAPLRVTIKLDSAAI